MGQNEIDDDLLFFVKRSLYQKRPVGDIIRVCVSDGYTEEITRRAIEIAAKKIAEQDATDRSFMRTIGIFVLLFGVIMLSIAYYLSGTDIPSARYGRLIVCFLMGFAAVVYGLWLIVTGRDTDLF